MSVDTLKSKKNLTLDEINQLLNVEKDVNVFKKLLYFWIKLNENANMIKMETTHSYELEHSLLNSATASLTDFIDEEEEDED